MAAQSASLIPPFTLFLRVSRFFVWKDRMRQQLTAECRVFLSIRIESLFQERIAVHVVAILFPESGNVTIMELHPAHPFH